MKYNDNGTYKDIYVKAFDTLPIGTEVDYDGNTVPQGWTEVNNVLYEATGTLTATNTITLNESIANYSEIEIYYCQTSKSAPNSKKARVDIINGGSIVLNIASIPAGTSSYSRTAYFINHRFSINNDTITFNNAVEVAIQGTSGSSATSVTYSQSTTPTNCVIYKVVGYK